MKRLPVLWVALIVVVGCTPVGQSAVTTTSVDGPTSAPPTMATSTTQPPTTTAAAPGLPVAWIAPTGVPLAVTAVDGETIEVLTPCGDPTELTEGTPVYDVDVVIDPGHGGPIDTGAVAATGLKEKTINLEVGIAVHDILTERGIHSMLTRSGDYPIPIPTRAAYADLVGAEAVVSIHHNAPEAPPSDVPGVEVFVQHDTPESARLGGLLYEAAMAALGRFQVDWQRAPDAGVMTVLNSDGGDAYGMVRRPSAPSALMELGYIANRAEAELYADPSYVPVVATAIADAIEEFLTSEEEGAPLVEGRVFDPASGVGKDQCVEPDLELGRDGTELAVASP